MSQTTHSSARIYYLHSSSCVFIILHTQQYLQKKQFKNPSTTVRYGTQGTNDFKAFKADSQCSLNVFALLKSCLISQKTIRLSAPSINTTAPTSEYTQAFAMIEETLAWIIITS